jgi:nitroreductase
MTAVHVDLSRAIRRAAVRATLAPSVHNTQPWRLALADDSLEIFAEWDRQLAYLDPSGRQLMISLGCATFNARVALETAGYSVRVDFSPDARGSKPVARLVITGQADAVSPLAVLDPVLELRQTNRRRFSADVVDPAVIDLLIGAAQAEGADLIELSTLDQRLAAARLTQRADREQNGDPAYRAELRAWTTSDPIRLDGVPAIASPHTGPASHDDIPIRDFDTRGEASLPAETESSIRQCLLVLVTDEDNPAAWLRAGEALERVWLEVFRNGLTASVFTSLIEQPATRESLRGELRTRKHPHALIRIGRAPRTPSSRRRLLSEVLTVATDLQ